MILKKAMAAASGTATEDDMALINGYALQPLTPEDVFVFSVKLCDDAPDRDNEFFPLASLKGLQPMFVGKPGIFDHCWSAKGQTARIFRTAVASDPGGGKAALADEDYCYLKSWAYIVKTEDTEPVIAQIAGGILKEVSVGCAMTRIVCSICGNDLYGNECQHRKGAEYDGRICLGALCDPSDAYEWSFVAVPAQPAAGTTKSLTDNASLPEGGAPSAAISEEDIEHELAVEKIRFGGN